MEKAYKIMLLVLWGGFLFMNFHAITHQKVDAGTGVLWIVIAAVVVVGICTLNPEVFDLAGDLATALLLIAQFLFLCILFDHEKRLTEVRRKNNELAMQIALIYDHMKYYEKKPTAVNKSQLQA